MRFYMIALQKKRCVFQLWIFIVLCFPNEIHLFNLETRLPMIKIGHDDSYFGYSVAEHQSVNEIGQIDQSWLLVGAPRDENLQPGTNKSGALWKCPLTTRVGDCIQVVTDGRRQESDGRHNDSHIFDVDASELFPPGNDEIKDGQWLGVTVKSQGPGGKVMVCAHRYISKGVDYQWGRGLCYTLKQVLEYDGVWEPCKGKPHARAHEEYGFCQAGTSGMIFDDTAIIGTPGPMTWKGTIFVLSVQDDFFSRDKITYMSPVSDLTSPVKEYSYLGMSVTAGYFFGNNMTTYVAGAPRGGNGTGQVVLFTKQSTAGENLLKVQLIIDGEQFASSFGYEIITADLNGDKRQDLIIAAPFYFERNRGGAVYIYINTEQYCLNCNLPIKLTGKSESRFGFSLANLGDINKDGYDDIAIGAPYESSGVVYIYLGSADGIVTEPSQILRAEDIPSVKTISTFGYSLSGGLDLDQNGYPDLVVGAYEKDMIFLFRSRPIIGIVTSVGPEANLRNLDPNRPGCPENVTSTYSCFYFETCCVIDSLVKTSRSNKEVKLKLHLEAETFNSGQKSSRIFFNSSFENATNVEERTVHINKGDRKYCQKHIAYLKKNIHDIQTPIQIKMTYTLIDLQPVSEVISGDSLPSLDNYPILNQQQADRIFQASFHNDCGGDICKSKLSVKAEISLEYSDQRRKYELLLGQYTDLYVNISVINDGESAYEAQLFIFHPSSISYGAGRTSLSETCRTEKDVVICDLGNPLKNSRFVNVNLRFDLRKLDDLASDIELIVFANSTSKEEIPKSPVKFPIAVIEKTILTVERRSFPDSEFDLESGEIKTASAMKYLEDIGSEVKHTYTIYNDGTWKVSNLEVHIEWPHQVANKRSEEKWLLYLVENPYIEGAAGKCTVNAKDVNPLRLGHRPLETPFESINPMKNDYFVSHSISMGPSKQNYTPSNALYNRVKRNVNEYLEMMEIFEKKNGQKEKFVNLNCLTGAKCIKFSCIIYNIPTGHSSKIVLKSRLWNSTIAEDYPNADLVKIVSRAKIPHISTLNPNDFAVETVIRVNILGKRETDRVPFFIIIIAILIGLLVFLLITCLLWKLGFFKRRRPDPVMCAKLEKPQFVEAYHDY